VGQSFFLLSCFLYFVNRKFFVCYGPTRPPLFASHCFDNIVRCWPRSILRLFVSRYFGKESFPCWQMVQFVRSFYASPTFWKAKLFVGKGQFVGPLLLLQILKGQLFVGQGQIPSPFFCFLTILKGSSFVLQWPHIRRLVFCFFLILKSIPSNQFKLCLTSFSIF